MIITPMYSQKIVMKSKYLLFLSLLLIVTNVLDARLTFFSTYMQLNITTDLYDDISTF